MKSPITELNPSSRDTPESHQRNADKLKRIPIKVEANQIPLSKPDWIRIKLGNQKSVNDVKRLLRERNLHSVCEEAACPNLSECFSKGTATFMILGDICTRRCPFCDVAHGKPKPPDSEEPEHLALAIADLALSHVVITSVDRDDLLDGGAGHFVKCIQKVRTYSPNTRVEILVPDFRGRLEVAIEYLASSPPDVLNHNLETVPRLYKAARPGANYDHSLKLISDFKSKVPSVLTKSGLMLGLGEEHEEILSVLRDLRAHGCEMLTLGQYLQPSREHYPVHRYVQPEEFESLRLAALSLGFIAVASAPLVRSSYHADEQAKNIS